MAVETLPYALSSLGEMRRLFGRDAIDLRASDIIPPVGPLNTAELLNVQDAIDEASDECFMRIQGWYDINSERTSNNLWLRRRGTTGACFYLSERRGNPANFQARWDRAVEELDKVLSGELWIPRLPLKADLAPGMSNVSIDDRFVIRKVRVEEQISTGGPQPNRDSDRRYFYYDTFTW